MSTYPFWCVPTPCLLKECDLTRHEKAWRSVHSLFTTYHTLFLTDLVTLSGVAATSEHVWLF
jgi:hypothetical protein